MTLNQFTNLNFQDIKLSIIDYLRQNSNFTDMDFEGSNLSVIINTLAYNTYITAYNTNMVANESFIDSATLRENVVSLARNIGYVPRSRRAARAMVKLDITGISTATASVNLEPGVISNSGFNQTNFIFSLADRITLPSVDGEAQGLAIIHQGQYLEKKYLVNTSLPNQKYILPNDGIDTSTLRVSVQNSASDTTKTEFLGLTSLVGVTGESNIFLIQETSDEKYELLFGDGIFGKKLESGNVITASYIVTDGPTGNGANRFNYSGTLTDDQGADIVTNLNVNMSTVQAAEGGDDIESVESIRTYAPRRYSAQNRAVTASDYEALLPSIYTNIESVSAYGGEDLNPPQYGRVFIAAKPRNGTFLPESTKRSILESLKSYSVAGIVPSFVDLKFLYVEIDTYIYYNTNFIGSPDNLRSSVIDSVTRFGQQGDLNKFGGRFKYSKLTTIIDSTDESITSNITNIRIRRNLKAKINQFANYELCFDNEFFRGNDSYNIKSTGFSVSNVSGTVYLADKVIEGSDIGSIFLFKMTEGTEVEVVIPNFGTVDYKKGEILINTVAITSTLRPENIIEIQAIPLSNDVLGRKELYLQLATNSSNFVMRQDIIASGANVSGTRFNTQSSYMNGAKVRGDLVTSNADATNLVGYVNGQAYYGPFHFHPETGLKMVGAQHVSTPHDVIYNTREESLGGTTTTSSSMSTSTSTTSTSTSTSSTSSSSSSSSGYGY